MSNVLEIRIIANENTCLTPKKRKTIFPAKQSIKSQDRIEQYFQDRVKKSVKHTRTNLSHLYRTQNKSKWVCILEDLYIKYKEENFKFQTKTFYTNMFHSKL